MDILSATEQIEGAVRAYLSRDEHGLYRIPFEMQRPIIMMGPPGVGKTAIVSQIAQRMGINFVSYSITHHTRQSALGLPYIAEASFDGSTYKVSRYTMSEIIASVYDAIERSGVKEGILFLDEVNCASETLAPAMLQFLQYKTFGQHRLPEGWVIVSAGNPPEFNRAAREFDPAMMDRLKRIDVAPDVEVWQNYAVAHGVHPAILTYLANKPKNFYMVRASVHGSRMVTARGWEDLSRMIQTYEHEGIKVALALVSQYLQDKEIAEDFSLYYELFSKYQDDYKVKEIISGRATGELVARASQAPFDERIAVVNLLLDAILDQVHANVSLEEACLKVRKNLLTMKEEMVEAADPVEVVLERVGSSRKEFQEARAKGILSRFQLQQLSDVLAIMESIRNACLRAQTQDAKAPIFGVAKEPFNEACRHMVGQAKQVSHALDNALAFLDAAFGQGQELVAFVSKLSCDPIFMRFVSRHGSKSFVDYSQTLMFSERGLDLLNQVNQLEDL